MFHVNAWGLPYVACMVGAKLVFPGAGLDGKSLYELFEARRDHVGRRAHGVAGAAGLCGRQQAEVQHHARTVIGGSACPPAMIRKPSSNGTACTCCTPGA
jgi:hypothetical protein